MLAPIAPCVDIRNSQQSVAYIGVKIISIPHKRLWLIYGYSLHCIASHTFVYALALKVSRHTMSELRFHSSYGFFERARDDMFNYRTGTVKSKNLDK